MSLIKFINSNESINVTFSLDNVGRTKLKFNNTSEVPDIDILLSGFVELNEHNGVIQSDYSAHKYLYKDGADGVNYVLTTDENDVYVESEIIPTPEPEPYIPTLGDIKNSKKQEVLSIYNNAMNIGTRATLSDGDVINFSITQDFINTVNTAYLSAITLYGIDGVTIPFEIENTCYSFSPIDVIVIYIKEQEYIIYNKSLKNELINTIETLETADEVNSIEYSVDSLSEECLVNFNKSLSNGINTINAILQKYQISTTTVEE